MVYTQVFQDTKIFIVNAGEIATLEMIALSRNSFISYFEKMYRSGWSPLCTPP